MNGKLKKIRVSLGQKWTAFLVLLGAVLSLVAILVSYQVFSSFMNRYYDQLGNNLVRTLASQLDPADLDHYYESRQTDAHYYEIQRFIRDLVENNEVQYLYVVRPEGDGVIFLFDSDMEMGDGSGYEGGAYCALGSYTDLFGEFAVYLDDFQNGRQVDPIIQNDPSYGWLMTASTPVLHEDGTLAGYVMADISMNEVMSIRQNFLMALGGLMVAITVTFLVLFLIFIRRRVVRPINQLTQATGEFIQSNESELASGTAKVNVPPIHTGDEVEQLADAFREMEQDMISYIQSFVKITAEKERIGAELNVATQIQADMLPRIFPAFPGREEFDIYATMNPAKEVGGDFYDFFLVDDDHLAVVIADVSGKGVPAALFMVIAKTIIKNHAQNKETPSEVFTQTNEQLCEGNDAGLFVTAWMGVLEISTGQFTYVNAGHNPPLLLRKGESFEWLKSRPGFVLAGMEGVRYRENTIQLNPGDRLYLYTDGVTEATNGAQELFGEERLQNALNEALDLPVQQLLKRIKECIDAFVGEAEQFDDITMLGLEYRQKGAGRDG
ncbi:MAG TPA: SpoIIE family protein phosphatase [Candidatus Flavonifractor merdigallinarum]|uniref:SpoIIE family protein phosphatase n=1 Tax=Candidatus Flavonifractor merdigallinarum TaxID=2838589 RepID=A0A9D1YAQ6_9FIRM|nr:SpoIIE family protein phosphatase [Candidatus Flavonifractor merdigallinarum]